MKANSDKSKQSNKAMHRVLAGVLCGASVLSLVLSLVMPPISQAIANDAQAAPTEETVADENTLDEKAGAGNSTGKDAENRISDDAEGGASEDAVTEDQPSDDTKVEGDTQSADDGANGDGAIALAAGNESTYTINNGAELSEKLLKKALRDAKGCATFELVNDIECNQEIGFEQTVDNPINITINLNGHKIKYTNQSQPLFNITGGATLTIKDLIKDSDSEKDPEQASEKVTKVQELNDQGQNLNPNNYGKEAVLSYDNGIPSNLIYYVTQSSPSATDTTKTTETLYEHSVDIKGAIVACGGSENLTLININDGGHFSLESGVLTTTQDAKVSHLIYAGNGSTVNMNGGYVCGGYCPDHAAGAGISVDQSTLNIYNGVIAGNCAPSGGGVYANGSAVTVAGGVISGNSTLNGINGYGGGLMAEGGSVTVSGGCITNNRYARFCGEEGNGDHGGAGLAAKNGAHVTISGGQITGNYSEEAGGGVYVTDQWRDGSRKDMAWLNITGGIIASNVSCRSEGAGIRVGQKVDAFINGPKESNGTKKSIVYITNNTCLSRFDWGGGGIFVQGNQEAADEAGRLFVYNSYISSNTAGGYGGGVAVCPSGKTLVTNTDGTAIFGNNDAQDAGSYDSQNNNSGNPHLSGGGKGKNQDMVAYNWRDKNGELVFRNNGHADFFLAAEGHEKPVAVVTGKMLGGGDARYSGSIELEKAITIPADGAVGVKNSIGLTSGVMSRVTAGDKAAIKARDDAQNEATTFITGNYSWDHGGGIMSNGDLYLGQPTDAYVYPSIKATKELIDSQTGGKKPLTANEFTFKVYRKGSEDPFANGTFNRGACTEVGNAVGNDANGNITFSLGEQSAPSSSADKITYYLVEDAGNDSYIRYDPAVYEIVGTLKDNVTELMSVPTLNDKYELKKISVHNYTLTDTSVTKHSGDSTNSLGALKNDGQGYYLHDDGQGYYSIVGPGEGKTFTNKYTSSFSWTPEATKVVEGGEMKEFTLEFADNEEFENAQYVKTQANGGNSQTLNLVEKKISYTLDDPTKDAGSTGRSAPKDFPYYYYVCEKDESKKYPHYKFDHSVYRFEVDRPSVTNGTINYKVTYMKGFVGSDGKWTAEDNAEERTFIDTSAPTPTSIPTFTNTYSTSLPLSGMSGVTLTYLAGAAVLCAAAAWMHIRRKANAKGGERRE